MADIVTTEQLQNASLDAQALEQFINGSDSETVLTRLNTQYPTLQKAIKQMFENGGLPATPFKTKALMTASSLANDKYAMVTDDSVNNGLYVKTAGAWVKSAYDPIMAANAYTRDLHSRSIEYFKNKSTLLSSTPVGSSQIAYADDANQYYIYANYEIPMQPETLSLFSRMSAAMSDNSKKVVNKTIFDLKALGLWEKLDGLWFGRNTNEVDSRLNWVASNSLIPVGSVPSSQPASSSSWSFKEPKYYYDTGVAVGGTNKAQARDISIGAIVQALGQTRQIAGVTSDENGLQLDYSSLSSAGFSAKINSSNSIAGPVLPSEGFFATATSVRSGDRISLYDNARLATSGPAVDTVVINDTIKIGTATNTPVSRGETRHIYAFFVGASLTSAEVASIHSILSSYINNFAKNNTLIGSWRELSAIKKTSGFDLDSYIFNGEKELVATKNLIGTINESVINQEYKGGYIEIQPDSYDSGTVPDTDATTKTWGFPYSLKQSEQARLKKEFFAGDGKGIQYIRFPLGFAYRGYRNIDPDSGLARNIGERFKGQNASLKKLFADIAKSGGGLAPEYWCPPVHWLTGGKYHGGNNITAGGSYARGVTLDSIRLSDPAQYAAQIDAFTDAILDDYEYLHTNIAPVRMYGLSNEPYLSNAEYGACHFSPDVYSDVLLALHPKVMASEILSEWEGEDNKVLLHVASDATAPNYWARAEKLIATHPEWIWAYSFHAIERFNGEVGGNGAGFAADFFRSTELAPYLETYDHVFSNEFEYFEVDKYSDQFKCANNMLYYINSVVYANSQLIMPIIHVCKQIGPQGPRSNMSGYALTACNLQEGYGLAPSNPLNAEAAAYGTWSPIAHNFNSWKFIADNLPIGAVRVGGTPVNNLNRCNYVAYKFEGKLLVFIANSSAEAVKVSLTFDENKQLFGKQYSIKENGTTLKPKNGAIIDFVVPAYSGQFWSQ